MIKNNIEKLSETIGYEVETPVVDQQSEQLIDFLLHLNDKGLINNHDFDYEKEAKKYIKKIRRQK